MTSKRYPVESVVRTPDWAVPVVSSLLRQRGLPPDLTLGIVEFLGERLWRCQLCSYLSQDLDIVAFSDDIEYGYAHLYMPTPTWVADGGKVWACYDCKVGYDTDYRP